jgi:hypothetical protein
VRGAGAQQPAAACILRGTGGGRVQARACGAICAARVPRPSAHAARITLGRGAGSGGRRAGVRDVMDQKRRRASDGRAEASIARAMGADPGVVARVSMTRACARSKQRNRSRCSPLSVSEATVE